MSLTITELLRLSDLSLQDTITSISESVTSSPTTYGFTAPVAVILASKAAAFEAAMNGLEAAELAYRAAVQDKNTAREDLVATYGNYLQMPYANPAVSNGTLATIFLAPRSTRGPQIPPVTPSNFEVTPQANGFVKFRWNRNGNNSNTSYVLEQKIGTEDWDVVLVSSRSRVELSGYAPGVTVSFRVIAVKGEDQSEPSTVQTIYPVGGFGEIAIAA